IEGGKVSEDEVLEMLLEHDIEDVKTEDGNIVVTTSPEGYGDVYELLQQKGLSFAMSEISYVPQISVPLDEDKAGQCLRLIEQLEDHDDVQNVYSNYDISDEVMEKINEEQ
ncbi:MAG TPA: YebC/PmpR family DNA-binding transcriptional regulator, partial [Spirochaetota bacterium]|nr:YebC/PmpR family DNA-binding transcriptional regulator [Spirochaetota bacterium]